ncbi:MAG: type II toxin-antitoxin system RelE/ParE family toxin [Candidatus Eisenbacteria bacterium]|nr:type II toxin-antitoxin system RelE/ParE family toxin [Candidatus Eisenbacteria bacterium]
MKRAVRLMGRAERDVAEARDWYESQSSGLGVRFVVTILTALSRLADEAERHPVYSRRTRRLLVPGFPYLVLYLVESDRVIVTGVVHTGRHPSVWRTRIHEGALSYAAA